MPNLIRSSGRIGLDRPIPGHRAIDDGGHIGPDGYPSATVGPWSFGTPTKPTARRSHTEGVAWCTCCEAAASSSDKISHSPFCPSGGHLTGPQRTRERMAPTVHRGSNHRVTDAPIPAIKVGAIGAHLPAPIDGPRALAPSRRTEFAVRNGAGKWSGMTPMSVRSGPPDIRPDVTPEFKSSGKRRTRLTAARPDRGSVVVGRLSALGAYAIRMGLHIPIPALSTGKNGGRYWVWDTAYSVPSDRELIQELMIRAANAVAAGIRNGRYDSVLTDDYSRPPTAACEAVRPSAHGSRNRPLIGGAKVDGLFLRRPAGAPPITAVIRDTVLVEDDSAYLESAIGLDRKGRPKAVRWNGSAPATALDPELAHYGYLALSDKLKADAMATVAALRAIAIRLPQRSPITRVPDNAIRYGIGQKVTATGDKRKVVVRRRRRRADIVASTAPQSAPKPIPERLATDAQAMVDGGLIG